MENIGKELKKKRIEKDISLETIAKETRIQMHILEALEQGKTPDVGGRAYVKVILLSYARAIGCDEAELSSLFNTDLINRKLKNSSEQTELFPKKFMFNKNLLFGILLIIAIIVLVLIVRNIYDDDAETIPLIRSIDTLRNERTTQPEESEEDFYVPAEPDAIIDQVEPEEVIDQVDPENIQQDISEESQQSDETAFTIIEEETSSNTLGSNQNEVDRLAIILDSANYINQYLLINTESLLPLKHGTSSLNKFVIGRN